MNRREKTLAWVIGSMAGLFAVGYGIRGILVKPVAEVDKKIAAVREKLDKIKAERTAYFTAEDFIKKQAPRAFAEQVDQASAKSGEMLTQQILKSGLRESDFSRLPAGPRKLHGASELGWSVQGEGKLDNVINLLFLLETEPHLHRVEGLVVTPSENAGRVRVRFRFLTLVLDPAPIVEPVELKSEFTLASAERHLLDSIVRRDILRPYIKRSPNSGPPDSLPSPATPLGPENFRVVSLSEWLGQPEIHVRDLARQTTTRYKPGDALAGGMVVMVDYRALPMPGKEDLKSFSRVIVKIDNDYWAIERGQTLADKYKLGAEKLPEHLAARAN